VVTLKKLKFIAISLIFFISASHSAYAVDPKLKVLGSMAVYGTAGGALLGTATLAFDGEGRNVAKGASLGLYAGLLFGGFVVVSHMVKRKRAEAPPPEDYYPDAEKASPYEKLEESDGYYPEEEEEQSFNLLHEVDSSSLTAFNQMEAKNARRELTSFYVPLVNFTF